MGRQIDRVVVNRVANLVIIGALLVIGVRLGPQLLARALHPPIQDGEIADIEVVVGDHRVPLSQLAPGSCRFVVVYWDDCVHSQRLAHHWRQDMERHKTPPIPNGWQAIWVSRFSTSRSELIHLPPRPVLSAVAAADDDDLTRRLEITGYPSHVILDRDGRIVSRGVGGTMPKVAEQGIGPCTPSLEEW